MKALFWDRTGFVIIAKRLERGRFRLRCKGDKLEIDQQNLELLLASNALRLRTVSPRVAKRSSRILRIANTTELEVKHGSRECFLVRVVGVCRETAMVALAEATRQRRNRGVPLKRVMLRSEKQTLDFQKNR